MLSQLYLFQVSLVCISQKVITNLELTSQKQLQEAEEQTNDPLILSKKMQLESKYNGRVMIKKNKDLLKKKKKGKRTLEFKEKKLLFHRQTGAQ